MFALVGIAGEDDLDAPDILTDPSAADHAKQPEPPRKAGKGTAHRPPLLNHAASGELRDQLLIEIGALTDGEELALWAYRRLPAKNTLTEADSRLVELAYQTILLGSQEVDLHGPKPTGPAIADGASPPPSSSDDGLTSVTPAPSFSPGRSTSTTVLEPNQRQNQSVTPMTKPVRRRNKAHLAFVAQQPCLICKRSPCDPHHLKFAQPNTLGRKVSDEFTVPLCRDHHHDLHRRGNEMAWWADMHVTPTDVARKLWQSSPIHDRMALQRDRSGKSGQKTKLTDSNSTNDSEQVTSS